MKNLSEGWLLIFHALSCCAPHASLLSYTPTPKPKSRCPCFTRHHHRFVSSQVFGAQFIASQHPRPHLTVFCHFFFSRSPASHLLSVSIGGHGLGKPTEQLQNVEELFLLFCQHGGWGHQLSVEYPILSLFSPLIVLSPILFPSLLIFISSLLTVCLVSLSHFFTGQTNGLTE